MKPTITKPHSRNYAQPNSRSRAGSVGSGPARPTFAMWEGDPPACQSSDKTKRRPACPALFFVACLLGSFSLIPAAHGGNIQITTSTTISDRQNLTATADGYTIAEGATLTLENPDPFAMTLEFNNTNPNRGGAALFSLNDITFDGDGSIHARGNVTNGNNGAAGYPNGGGAIYTQGALNFSGNHHEILFEDNRTVASGGAIFTYTDLHFSGSNDSIAFLNNTSSNGNGGGSGGAIFAYNGKVIFSGAAREIRFENNHAEYGGGAIKANSNEFRITGTYGEIVFAHNTTSLPNAGAGGGGAIQGYGVIIDGEIGNLLFESNTAATLGGAIYSSGSVSFAGRGGTIAFRDNAATGIYLDGGGAINAYRDIRISGTYEKLIFDNNRAINSGGALQGDGNVILSGSVKSVEFTNNVAKGSGQYGGGAIDAGGSSSNVLIGGQIDDLRFIANSATSAYGGAITTFNNITISSTGNVLFQGNQAMWGGAVYILGYYSGTSSFIANGGDITFKGNRHLVGTEWEGANAIYLRAYSSTQGLVLAANDGNHIYFYDPIESGTRRVDIAINPDSAHTGAVIFSGSASDSQIYASTTVHNGSMELLDGASYGMDRERGPNSRFTIGGSGTLRSAGSGTNRLDAAVINLDSGARIQIDDGSTLLVDSDSFALTDGVTLGAGLGQNTLLLADPAALLSVSGSVTIDVVAGGTFTPQQSLEGTDATLAKTGEGVLLLTEDNSTLSGRLAIDEGIVQISSTANLGHTALDGSAMLVIDQGGDFGFSGTHAAGNFDGTVRLQNQTNITLDNADTATRDILARSTLELADGGQASTVRGQDYSLASLHLAGGTLDLATVEFKPEGLITTGTLTTTSGTIKLRDLTDSGTLPTPEAFPDRDFLSQSTVIGEGATLLVAAETLAGDLTQITVTDASGATLGESYRIDYDDIVTATYGTIAISGTKDATGESGLFLSANLTELDIHADKTLELRTDNLAANSDRTLAARLTGSGNLLVDGQVADGDPNYLILSHAANDHTGLTTVATGNELRGGNHDIIAHSAALVLQDGAVFDTGAYNQGLRAVAGSGTLRISDAAATLTLTGQADSVSTAAVIGSGNLVKDGASTQSLGVIDISGTTTINAGVLNAESITSAVVNHARLNVTGDLNGSLVNTGTARILGVINGDVTNSGLINDLKRVIGNVENTGRIQLVDGNTYISGALTGTGGIVRFRNLGDVLTLGDLSGSQTFANVEIDFGNNTSDTIHVAGDASGHHRLRLVKALGSGDPVDPSSIVLPVVFINEGDAIFTATLTAHDDDIFTGNDVDAGMYSYTLVHGGRSASTPDDNIWYLAGNGQSDMADDIISTAAILGADWHYSLDSLRLRMGELHGASAPSTGNIWLRTYGYHLNASAKISGAPFDQDTWGVTAGADKAFAALGGTLYTGGFVQMGHSSRDYDHDGSSTTGSVSAGVYVTWINPAGWYVDAVAKFDRYKNDLEVTRLDSPTVSADYSNTAQGLSLEAGRRLTLANIHEGRVRFWAEPMVQAAVAWLNGANYATNEDMAVRIDDATAYQYRFQLRAGADIGRWVPYVKVAEVKSDTNGGAIHAQNYTKQPDFDGWRFEAGAGAAYLIDERSQLYLDYEYNKATAYERPWAINLGYRRAW